MPFVGTCDAEPSGARASRRRYLCLEGTTSYGNTNSVTEQDVHGGGSDFPYQTGRHSIFQLPQCVGDRKDPPMYSYSKLFLFMVLSMVLMILLFFIIIFNHLLRMCFIDF